MGFRGKMRVSVSNAERTVARKLVEEQVSGFFRGFKITLDITKPDLYFDMKRLCIYIDGPPHLKERQQIKDGIIDEKLEKRGYTVLRFPYKPPLTKKRLREIVDRIKEALER